MLSARHALFKRPIKRVKRQWPIRLTGLHMGPTAWRKSGRIALMLCLIFTFTLQTFDRSVAASSHERRVALVIGNSHYENLDELANPKNDERLISKTLGELGFEVTERRDLSFEEFTDTVKAFSDAAQTAQTVLLYFAGHGFQFGGRNYLVPVDATLRDRNHFEEETLAVDGIISGLQRRNNQTLVFLDACRNNPMPAGAKRNSDREGLAQIENGSGLFVAFATQPGNITRDGKGKNSPFAEALASVMPTAGISISDMMIRVRNMVEEKTFDTQTPWDQSSLRNQFYFKPDNEESDLSNEDIAALSELPKNLRDSILKRFAGNIAPAERSEERPSEGLDQPAAAEKRVEVAASGGKPQPSSKPQAAPSDRTPPPPPLFVAPPPPAPPLPTQPAPTGTLTITRLPPPPAPAIPPVAKTPPVAQQPSPDRQEVVVAALEPHPEEGLGERTGDELRTVSPDHGARGDVDQVRPLSEAPRLTITPITTSPPVVTRPATPKPEPEQQQAGPPPATPNGQVLASTSIAPPPEGPKAPLPQSPPVELALAMPVYAPKLPGELTRPLPPAEADIATPEEDQKTYATDVQRQLQRLGCYRGAVDGQWGKKSEAALLRYAINSKQEIASTAPSVELLNLLQTGRDNLCPAPAVVKPQNTPTPKPKVVSLPSAKADQRPAATTSSKPAKDVSTVKKLRKFGGFSGP